MLKKYVFTFGLIYFSLICSVSCDQPDYGIVSRVDEYELEKLAKPLVIDESKYGCGPLLEPRITYYLSLEGDDDADGISWKTSWRNLEIAIPKLQPGDTLYIKEGEYRIPRIVINQDGTQSGEPGKPITIAAAPGHRVIITTSRKPKSFKKSIGFNYTYETLFDIEEHDTVWESDTLISLENAGSIERVEELPGTFWGAVKGKKLYVHFSDSRGPDVHSVAILGESPKRRGRPHSPHGIALMGSYFHLKGLWFKHDHTTLSVSGHKIQDKIVSKSSNAEYKGGHHNTIENCAFFSTDFSGLCLLQGAKWNLIKGNYGIKNGMRGSILIYHKDAGDNLLIENRLDSSSPTIRTLGKKYHYGINNYGYVGRRNHIINNIMNDTLSFRSKFMFKETVIQGNVMLGQCSTVPSTYIDNEYKPIDRVIFRNNTFLGAVRTAYHTMGEGGPGGNWSDASKVFINNIALLKNKQKEFSSARFADPTYLDFRLQSDSPFIGNAVGASRVGAFREQTNPLFYVSISGNDESSGRSLGEALKTLKKATSNLKAGDTLYISAGDYQEPLVIKKSGTGEHPIKIRAFNRQDVKIPTISIEASNVIVEGFKVSSKSSDCIKIKGTNVQIKKCTVYNSPAAGIRLNYSDNISISHCTIVGNKVGLFIGEGSKKVILKDSIVSKNTKSPVILAKNYENEFLESNNCYFGNNTKHETINRDLGSIIAEPKFVSPGSGDYRLKWDSPAASLDPFGRPAGAYAVSIRKPRISKVKVEVIRNDSAVVTWRTPTDDTIGDIKFRAKGEAKWRKTKSVIQGTFHSAGLSNLNPGVDVEFYVNAKGRRGGQAKNEIYNFKTIATPRNSQRYYVSPTGNDKHDGLSTSTAWQTIRKACINAGPGDIVFIAPGEYNHPLVPLSSGKPEQPIIFKRHGEGEAVIQGNGAIAPLIELTNKDYITIDGLIIAGAPKEGGYAGIVAMRKCRYIRFVNCRIGYKQRESGFGRGITLNSCNNIAIEGNIVWGTRYHVTCYNSPNTLIKNNTFLYGQVYSVEVKDNHRGTKIINNIYYYPTTVQNAAIAIFSSPLKIELKSDYNLFFLSKKGKIGAFYSNAATADVLGTTLEEWTNNSGLDINSIHGDPKFVNLSKGDFRLKKESPAIGTGFAGLNIGSDSANKKINHNF